MIKNLSSKHCDLLDQVFKTNPEALLLLDIRGKVIKVNSRVEKLLGYKSKEIVGTAVFKLPFMSKESLSMIKKKFLKRLSGKKMSEYDVEIEAKNGGKLIGSVLGQVLKNKKGFPVGAIVVVRDVTEQRTVFTELKELQKRTERYLDVSGSMIVVLGQNSEIKLINRMGLELLGYKSEEILGKNWIDLVIPKGVRDEIKKVFAKVISGKEEFAVKNENEVITKNGEILLIKWNCTVLRGDDGQVIEIVSSGLDVTGERKASASLEQAQEMLSLVMDHSAEVYYVNSVLYDRLDYVSDQCVQMMGYTPEELKKDWTIVLSDSEVNKEAVKNTKKAIETGEKQSVYFMEIKTKKGVIKMTEVDEFPIKNNAGKVTGLSGVVRDVSKRVEVENKLRSKIEQFESINKVIVGRELKMIGLKEKVSELESKLKGSKK